MPFSLCLAFILAAGLAAGLQFGPGATRLLACTSGGLAAATLLARLMASPRLFRAAGMATLCAGAALHGQHAAAVAERGPLRQWFDEQTAGEGGEDAGERLASPVRMRGRLVRDATAGDTGARLQIAVSEIASGSGWRRAEGGVSVTVGGSLTGGRVGQWRAGRTVEMPVLLRRATRYLNDGVPDGERALARRGTALVGSVKSAALVEVVSNGPWWDERAAKVRGAVRRAMQRHVAPLDETSAAVGTAILIGDRAAMTPDLERRLQEAGTYHVVAISGGNIALLAAAVLGVLWAAGIRFSGAAAAAIVALAAHAWVIGGGASVVRATVMAVIYLALRLIDQRTAPAQALGVAAGVMLIAQPLGVADAGFWLTFGATGALLAASARLRLPRPWRWWHAPAAIAAGSLAVELLLAPVSALVFQRVTLAGLGLNLAAVPAMAGVQLAASVCVLAEVLELPAMAALAAGATHASARLLIDSSSLVDAAPWMAWRVPAPGFTLLALYYGTAAAWWYVSSPPVDSLVRRRLSLALGLLALAAWTWIVASPDTLTAPATGRLAVSVLDVGQGDAVLVTCPDGTTLLVDAGGLASGAGFDLGDRVVGPALRGRGVTRLDYLAITHADADHVGGAQSLLRDFRPREVWVGVPVPRDRAEQTLRAAADAAPSAWRWLRRGDRLHIGPVEIRVHHPPEPDWERQRVRNDDSIVLELRLGEMSILLTGDITSAVEEAVAERLDSRRTIALKVPHHGSASSSSARLLDHLAPAVAFVSAGRGNPFGHPAPAVLARYRERGIELFRTDRDGQIDLVTDGRSLEVKSYTGRRWRLR